jgi:hypothetical protein
METIENQTKAGERTHSATAQVVPKLLTDGSLVYDVQILNDDSVVEINALSERHAIECASDIRVAIDRAEGRIA